MLKFKLNWQGKKQKVHRKLNGASTYWVNSNRKNAKNVNYLRIVQDFPFENCQKEMAVALKKCLFDPILVKPKCVWEAVVFSQFSKICLHFSAVCIKFFKKTTASQSKHILALPICGQICPVLVLQSFFKWNTL